jgi:hypothetical protein
VERGNAKAEDYSKDELEDKIFKDVIKHRFFSTCGEGDRG